MEKRFFFELKTIPDFTLVSYQAINMSDLGSVMKNNAIFLRQLHSLGIVFGMSFHLYYSYNPSFIAGEKIKIFLMCLVKEEKYKITDDVLVNIFSSLAASRCFKLKKCLNPLEEYTDNYKCFNSISKKEYMVNPNYDYEPPSNGLQYYSISEWKATQNARLYNSLELLGHFEFPTLIRVDIYPVEDSESILTDISKMGVLTKIQAQASFKAFGENGISMARRDEAASKANSFYDDYYKTMASSLQFASAINVFGNSEYDCKLLGDVICSEVLEKGMINQKSEKGDFKADFKLVSPEDIKVSIFDENYNSNKVPKMASLFTVEEISPFFSFPYLYPGEHIEIKKETDPALIMNGFKLGVDRNGYDVCIPFSAFAKHAYISGVPGSGKTYSMKHIIHSLSKVGIPFLVFEPAKREYRGLYDIDASKKHKEYGIFEKCEKTDDIILFCPKTNSLFPLHINPFEIPVGVAVDDYVSVLYDVFNGSFSWPQPTPAILKTSLYKVYRKCGFYGYEVITEDTRKKRKFPTIDDLYETFKFIMDTNSSYRGEVQGNIKGILETRIGSLREGNAGEIFNVGCSSIKPENWNKKKIILELENLSKEHANFVTLLVVSLIRLDLKMHPTLEEFEKADPRVIHNLRHVIFFEEAHNLIGKKTEADSEEANSKIASTSFIKDMLAEVRAYKQGIVIADQLPTALAPDILKNTSIKIAHKQIASDEREAIGSVMSADSVQLEELAKFEKGKALVTFEGVQKPFYVQVEVQYKYSSDTRDDILIAKQLALSSDWFFIYLKTFAKMIADLNSRALNYNRMVYELKEKNDKLFESVNTAILNNNYSSLYNDYTALELRQRKIEFEMLYKDKGEYLIEELNKHKLFLHIMIDNGIDQVTENGQINQMYLDCIDVVLTQVERNLKSLDDCCCLITKALCQK